MDTISITELAFRATLQFQISLPKRKICGYVDGKPILESGDVWGFGSGFMIYYRGQYYFITADHNVHPEEYDENTDLFQRSKHDYGIEIITNVKGEGLSSIMQPIGCFYNYTGYNFDNSLNSHDEPAANILQKFVYNLDKSGIDITDETMPIGCRIPDFIDIAFSIIQHPFEVALLTNKVVGEDEYVIVNEGDSKVTLNAENIENLKDQATCVVAGTIHNEFINGGAILCRDNAFYELMFSEADSNNKEWYFYSGSANNIKDWKGLSGAPVLNADSGQLIGMLVNGPRESGLVRVIPINKILNYIDMSLIIERAKQNNLK